MKATRLWATAVTAALAFLCAARPAPGQAAAPSADVEIGLCGPLSDLDALQAAGFDYAELRTSEIAKLSDAEFDALAERLQRMRVRVPTTYLFIPAEIKVTGPAADEARLTSYVQGALARVAKLGTRTVVFGSGGARAFPEGFPKEQAFRQLVAFCKRLGPLARRHGINIAIEPLRKQECNLINNMAEGLELVEAVNDPNVGLNLDLYHLAEEKEDAAIVRKARGRVYHVHVANPNGRVFPLRAEEYDYAPFFANLRAIGYRDGISVEASTKDMAREAPQSIALLKALMRSAGQAPASPPQRSYRSNPVDTAHGDREFVLLWPQGAPGALGDEPLDKPKLTFYRAPAGLANGAAAVVCPGGGYRNLASDHEGKQVAEWLNSLGVSAFVLQYRVGPRYHHPAPLLDAQRALRLVRARSAELAIDPGRVGIVGFSAGGHLASTAGTRFDEGSKEAADPVERFSSRPDFLVLGYPVILMTDPYIHKGSVENLLGDAAPAELRLQFSSDRNVTARTPPAFLFHTSEDASVPVQNSLAFYSALQQAKVPAELHVFPKGPHGVGLAPWDPVLSQWPKLCAAWLKAMGLLDHR